MLLYALVRRELLLLALIFSPAPRGELEAIISSGERANHHIQSLIRPETSATASINVSYRFSWYSAEVMSYEAARQ